ncbi:hypothetical protein SPRG_22358 [Saprolegnia parasitica CBS 223.65]|uniref:WW domain-containing protein n=1 Tax=Saprolegnia parasitica (strain CBS 223.65) TaxID=695850 RepID=A0A067BLB6_SAPPC|nr:hypothetical protein SPRG_22358 [Saprolegnia parasitica CBS 223.65]KDO19003.1 hypothetical protein SPRG_22358 [Saprolegnia parasitica CBS 223.65]|eukprot:XP_012210290.1 hypothetical protein SPRG_22358 [Saprolegnia parasitica CBS 223.65]
MQAVDTPAAIQPVADAVATDDEARKLLKKVLEKRKAYQARATKALRREEVARLKAAKEAERAQEAAQRALRDKSSLNASAKSSPKKKKMPESVSAIAPPVKTAKDFEVPSLLGEPVLSAETPTLTALLVVMTQFKGANLPPIPASARSAVEALHELLTNPMLGCLRQAQCKLLVNPSIVEFHVELASFESVPANSSFFLLIISHGVRVVSGPHLGSFVLFPESRLSSIEELALTAIHERKLVEALSRIPSTNKCIALDVCQDQDVAPNVTETAIKGRVHSEMATHLLALLHEKRPPEVKEDLPIVILEACKTRTETALYRADDPTVQSLFPRRLLDAFRGAGVSQGVVDYHRNWAEDSTKLPYIYLRDVVNYVVSRVQYDAYCYAERSKPTERKAALAQALGPSLEQTPQFCTKLPLVDFPLAFAPKPPSEAPAAPTLVPTDALSSITVAWRAPVAKPRQPFSPILGFHVECKGSGRACDVRDVRRCLSSTHVHSAKFLLEALRTKFSATQYPSGHATASWALRLLRQPAPRRRALGLQEAAMKIQGLYRRRQARRALRAVAAATYQAAVDPTTGRGYFYNTITGAATWTMPPSLRQ